MTSIWDLANPQLRDLAVYEPGKPIEETARELNLDPAEIVKLASNENPLGPSPKAIEAMSRALSEAQLYPDGSAYYLRTAIAEQLGLGIENIVLGNGSNEVIELLCHAFLRAGQNVVTFEHAFIAYKIAATVFGAHTIEAPAPDFRPDVEALLSAITPETRLVFIPNPNNPTGTLIPAEGIDWLIDRLPSHVVTVFDEAYYEFLDRPPDVLGRIRDGKNIVVLRTFSKIHGLAGLRIGYGLADSALIAVLQKTREPFNINSIAQAGALAAWHDRQHQDLTKSVVDRGRVYLQEQFAVMGLRFIPGTANFIMVRVGNAAEIFRKMLSQKVIVRPLGGYNLPEWIRVSVGTAEQNQKCIDALKSVLAK